MTLVDKVRAAGVVGAGGGGFPAHAKLVARADTVIANGAECEPLLHKDAAVMEREADILVRGLRLAMDAVGAGAGIIGIKTKNQCAITRLSAATAGTAIRVQSLGDFYPAGDEFDLVYETTGRLIPAGGIPPHVGVLVSNVETLANIARAAEGQPVTHKTVTIAGAVRTPVTLTVPVGTRFDDCLAAAGGATIADPVFCVGGLMMGETTQDPNRPITKTTAGLVVLPRDHPVVRRKLLPPEQQHHVGRSACDQCRYCTELCPRYLLGYPVEPHQVMRTLSFSGAGAATWNPWAAMCCGCGVCTLYACPEQLFPKEACDRSKAELRRAGVPLAPSIPRQPHGLRAGRKVPTRALLRKLALTPYDDPAPWSAAVLKPKRLVLPLRQGAGVAGAAIVSVGERVGCGQPLTSIPESTLGAVVHAPLAASVLEVTSTALVLAPLS